VKSEGIDYMFRNRTGQIPKVRNTCFKSSDSIAHGRPPTNNFISSRACIEIVDVDARRRLACATTVRLEFRSNPYNLNITDGSAARRPNPADGIMNADDSPTHATQRKAKRKAAISICRFVCLYLCLSIVGGRTFVSLPA
jgi:hypothetical protein